MAVREEIRAAQEASVSAVEAQLAKRSPFILINGRPISPEAAWAATQAIRKAWEVGGRYDGQQKQESGEWLARYEQPNGDIRLVSIGRFPGYDQKGCGDLRAGRGLLRGLHARAMTDGLHEGVSSAIRARGKRLDARPLGVTKPAAHGDVTEPGMAGKPLDWLWLQRYVRGC